MLGFVSVGKERAGLKSKPAPAPDVLPKPVTLADELATRGIKEIPWVAVKEYQRRYLREEQRARRAGVSAVWFSYTPDRFRQTFNFGGKRVAIPPEVEEKISRAKTIPETKVFVEYFFADPFVQVVRNKDGQHEEAYIAFWNAPGFKAE